jgi:carbohydrate diacid regulator
MLDISNSFLEIAKIITTKITDLLCAPVFVTNKTGIIVTSSEPTQAGQFLRRAVEETVLINALRVPLYHNTEMGEVIVGESYNHEPIPPRLAQALIELVVQQTITQVQFPSLHEMKNRLIYDLLHAQIRDESATLEQAKQLGMDLTQPRAVILIDAANYILENQNENHLKVPQRQQDAIEQRRSKVVISSIVSFFHLPTDTICADLGQGNIVVLKASNTKNLNPWAADTDDSTNTSWANLSALKRAADALLGRLYNDTSTPINIGIGRYHPGLQGLARSYKDAHIALSLGTRLQGENRVHCLGEMGIAAFVGIADEATKIDLAKYLLSPLNQEEELLITLNTFFEENCCPSSTAKRLSIHRNTLSYRLDKIASLTGLEPRKFDDAVQMRLSLLLRSL